MMDPLHRFTPYDHVVLGEKLRDCRSAVMGLLAVAPTDSETVGIARQTIAALDQLRSEMDCHLQTTRPLRRDPRRMTRHIYGDQTHISGCLASEADLKLDDFAGWELEEE
ncbi:MAG: hypothetical protein FKY71_13030 [Spiribacter salinus]|uniref:Uncharacterized protein n=1 Tax=Spiribacter salinus TaxID=1335746 RepID=A0A540VP94_9GAMM|nr:MAG: hypothetical protein FKY71_13030 [Spiribacter salinus]